MNMIKTHMLRTRLAALALAAAGLGLGPNVGAAGAADTAYYYDGPRKVALETQPELLAEFGRGRSTAQAAGASAQRVAGDSLVRVVRVASAAAALAAAQDSATGPARSPVFRQGGSAAGRLMALPGGVLVKFKPDWGPAQIDAWLAARGLPAGQPLAIGPAWRLVPTAAGQAALATANALHESGEVLSASPNWWTQTSAK